MVMTTTHREMEACLDVLEKHPPDGLTGCREWTVHDVAAHLAGNAAEIARTVEAYAERRSIPETRSFEEREIPFRALAHDALVRRIGDETTRMNRLLAE